MTVEELISDLNERIDKGIGALEEVRKNQSQDWSRSDRRRVSGKIQGLKTVKDWLRSYE